MDSLYIVVALAIFGAAFGSFAGAQVWRLRARQLVEDKKAGEEVDAREYKRLLPLTRQRGFTNDRSIDLDTGKQLAWYDMIPIVSWLLLKGKSRYSGKPIGRFEFVIEISMALFFALSYVFWPYSLDSAIEIAKFVLWLIAGVVLAIQFATDYKWKILWTLLSYGTIVLGVAYAGLTVAASTNMLGAVYSAAGAALIIGGLYAFLAIASRERWVGYGDGILGLGLGLLLADWKLALVALFMANCIGSLVVLAGFATGKMTRRQHVPFGPFLILGAIVAQLFGGAIISWYMSLLLV